MTIDTKYLSMPSNFFNTRFSKGENNKIYYVWLNKVSRFNPNGDLLEELLSRGDLDLMISEVKYDNNKLYLAYYSPSKKLGIGR